MAPSVKKTGKVARRVTDRSSRDLSITPRLISGSIGSPSFGLLQRVEDQRVQLELFISINRLLFSAKDLEMFFNRLAELLRKKLHYPFVHIWLKSLKEENTRVLVNISSQRKESLHKQKLTIGIVGKVIRTGKLVLARDAKKHPDYFSFNKTTKSQLCVPLVNERNECIGALNIESKTMDAFTERDVDILTSLAPSLSHAIEAASLYQKVMYSRKRYKNLIASMDEALWIGDSKNITRYVNPAFEHIFKCRRDKAVGRHFYDFFDEKNKIIARKGTRQMKNVRGGQFEVEMQTSDGENIPVLIGCAPTQEKGMFAFITDVRPIKAAQRKIDSLQKQEWFLATLTKNSMDAIVSLNEDDLVQTWNLGAERMFGYTSEEIVGQSMHIYVPHHLMEKNEPIRILDEAHEKGFIRNYETVRLHKSGRPITVSITCTAIKDSGGKLLGYIAIYRDVTVQKQAERELQERLDRLQEAYQEVGRQRRYIDYIVDLLEISTGVYPVVHVASFIVNALTMFARLDGCTLRVHRPAEKKAELLACTGVGEDWWGKKLGTMPGSIWERAMRLQRPIKISDITQEPGYSSLSLARKYNLRVLMVVPMFVQNEFVGTLSLYLSDENHDRAKEIFDNEFIHIFAKQAALVIKVFIQQEEEQGKQASK
ncbi:MAG: PAS domain S-box protein [Patescibacteria group bacterium]